jgi:hypothetical protein
VLVSTDVACTSVNSTAIAVGPPGDDTRSVTAKTTTCSPDGGIGMLVVTPSDGIGDPVGIRVTLGVGPTAADSCVAPNFDGCIVARRSLRYSPHTRLVLPVELEQDCLNQHCDRFTTCISGQCVDAGIPSCSETNTCEIDAGPPPDASACDLPATLVVPSQVPVTPHLVKMPTGYAVGYETSIISDLQRNYMVVPVSPNGIPGKPVQLNAEPIAGGASVGPLGTDTTNFAATYMNANGIAARVIDPSGNPLGEQIIEQAAFKTARAGMRYESNGSFYAYAFRFDGSATFAAWNPSSTTYQSNTVAPANVDDIALAFYNGVYYGAFRDATTCYLQPLMLGLGVFSTNTPNSWQLCSTVRFAENTPGTFLYFRTHQNSVTTYILQVSATVSAPNLDVDPVDDQAIVALSGTGKILRVVYAGGGHLRDMEVDTSLVVASKEDVVPSWSFTGDGIGFDAVAEPNSLTHAIAFYSATPSPGIYLTRICH